jgi:hypothetical protein
MNKRIRWLILVVIAALGLTPAAGLAQVDYQQEYPAPDPVFPVPLGHDRMDKGGLFVAGEFLFMRQTNPIKGQVLAFRGLTDVDGSITGTPGTFIGSHEIALMASDVGGPGTYQPGFDFTIGWRFREGTVVEFNWWRLFDAKYMANATLLPSNFNAGGSSAETFLFSPVWNISPDYAGPAAKLTAGNFFAAYGIWNGAVTEGITFTQRFDKYDITTRVPVYQNDCWRTYGLFGPRLMWQWERFWWRTVSVRFDGAGSPEWTADYTNVVSNYMYGVFIGCGNEFRCADTPIGTFAVSLDLEADAMIDFVREIAKYEREDMFTSTHRSIRRPRPVPGFEANFNVWYYPIEAVQIRVGWNVIGLINTIASPNPVDFNMGALTPVYEHEFRILQGLNAGVGVIF